MLGRENIGTLSISTRKIKEKQKVGRQNFGELIGKVYRKVHHCTCDHKWMFICYNHTRAHTHEDTSCIVIVCVLTGSVIQQLFAAIYYTQLELTGIAIQLVLILSAIQVS